MIKVGIVNELSKTILSQNGNITENRMTVLAGGFTMMLLVTSTQESIENILSKLEETGEKLNLTLIGKETQASEKNNQRVPYKITVVSMVHPGIVHDISDFFSNHNINIEEIKTQTYLLHTPAHRCFH